MKKISSLARYSSVFLFCLTLAVFLICGISACHEGMKALHENFTETKQVSPAVFADTYNVMFPGKQPLVTLNGHLQRLLGKKYLNRTYRLADNHLIEVFPEYAAVEYAEKTIQFRDALAEMGIPLVFISTPEKLTHQDNSLPIGIEDHGNENMDFFLSCLKNAGVDVLDLRRCVEEEGLDLRSMFYRTDLHWTAESGLWSTMKLAKFLTERDASYAVDPTILKPENYSRTIYEQYFLGGYGRRTGPGYAGYDDFTVITPTFETALHSEIPDKAIIKDGSFSDALMFPEVMDPSQPFGNRYIVYGSLEPIMTIENSSSELALPVQSTDKRILLFNDSFGIMSYPFLALAYDHLCRMDLRLYAGEPLDAITEFQPDIVLIQYSPYAMLELETTPPLFDFIHGE